MAATTAKGVLQQASLQHRAGQSLVVFAADLADLPLLQAAVLPGVAQRTLAADQGAVEGITAWLAETGARELVLVAHGEPGRILLGAEPITAELMQRQQALLLEWGVEAITLLSCRVGADEGFVAELERLTGAKVHAAAGLVGAPEQGGSWGVLDQAPAVLAEEGLAGYGHTLIGLVSYDISYVYDGAGIGAVDPDGTEPFLADDVTDATDTIFTANEATSVTISGTIRPQTQPDPDPDPQYDVLVGVYGSDGTLLYWFIVNDTDDSTGFTYDLDLKTALGGSYDGQFYFLFWTGTYVEGDLTSDLYSGDAQSLPAGFEYDVNPRTGITPNSNVGDALPVNADNSAEYFSSSPTSLFTSAVLYSIQAGNTPPQITGGTFSGSVTEDNSASASGVVSATDADGNTLSYSADSTDSFGTFTIDGSGNWTYSLTQGSTGDVQTLGVGTYSSTSVSRIVAVSDGTSSATTTVWITIQGVNDTAAFITTGATYTGAVTEDNTATASGTVVATDVDTSDVLSYSGSDGDAFGTFTVDTTGNWTYGLTGTAVQTLGVGTFGTTSVSKVVTASDLAGATTTTTVWITILGRNDAPFRASVVFSSGAFSNTSFNATSAGFTYTPSDIDASDSLSLVLGTNVLRTSLLSGSTYTFAAVQQSTTKSEGTLYIRDLASASTPFMYLGLGTSSADTLNAGSANTLVAGLWGFGGTDVLTGGRAADWLVGGTGADTFYLYGDSGSDTIYVGNDFGGVTSWTEGNAAAGGAADLIVWGFTSIANATSLGVKDIYGFRTDGGSLADVMSFSSGLFVNRSGATTIGANPTFLATTVQNITSSVDLAASRFVFFQYSTTTGSGELAATAAVNSTSVASLLSSWTVNSTQQLLFIVDDGTDSYLWFYDGSSTGNTTRIEAAELTLMATVNNVTQFGNNFTIV